MRLVLGLLFSLAVAACVGLGTTWLVLTRGTAFGAIPIGAWVAWPKSGTRDVDPYTRATFARTGELPVGSGDGVEFFARTGDNGRTLDGRSLVPLLSDVDADWNRATLVQCQRTIGVATRHYRYMDWGKHLSQQYEVYDMTADPYQLQNVAGTAQYADIQADLAACLEQLRRCTGSTCEWTTGFPPPPA